jgi:carbon monoxide dehydrogenase subunit G
VILNNQFTVAADLDTVWRHLLDIERVAGCLPGAAVTATGEHNTYDGVIRLKIGPMTVEYRGRATLTEVDDEGHTAVIELSGHEAKGQGTAMARIFNRLERLDSGTRVSAETHLNITGPQAQFGQGVIEDIGGRVMSEFSRRLEQQIAQDSRSGEAAHADSRQGTAPDADALDVGALVPAPVKLAVGLLVAFMLALALRWARRR